MAQLKQVDTRVTAPSSVHVHGRGGAASMAAIILIGAFALVVGMSLQGQGGGQPGGIPGELAAESAALSPDPTPSTTPTPDPSADPAPEATPAADPTPEPTPAADPTPEPTPTADPTPAADPTPEPEPSPMPRSPDGAATLPTGGSPLPDIAGALAGDDGGRPLPLGTITEPPNADRLDFLFEFCWPECFRDAHWMDPANPTQGSGIWTTGRPFHVREGFVNERAEPLGDGFDVVLYVTRMGDGEDHATYRYTSDHIVRGTSDQCGPTYETQTGPVTCEWFVHDFPDGLPEGRFAIWAYWEAPCSAWLEMGFTDTCENPDEVISLFSSGFDAPYSASGPRFTEVEGPFGDATAP